MKTMRKLETINANTRNLTDAELGAVSGGMPNGTINEFLGKPLPFTRGGAILDPPIPGPSVPLPVA
jgi:hypothetical protein